MAKRRAGTGELGLIETPDATVVQKLTPGYRVERMRRVAEEDLRDFATVSGDYNPVHMDEAFAATTPFRGRIAHGMLSGAWISALLAEEMPVAGSVYLSQSLTFKRPIRIGDEVTIRLQVSAFDDAAGEVTVATACLVRGKVAVDGQAKVLLPRTRRRG